MASLRKPPTFSIASAPTKHRSTLFQEQILNHPPEDTHTRQKTNTKHKLPYGTYLKIGHWNVENLKKTTAPKQLVDYMKQHHLALLFLSETHLTDSTHYQIEGFSFFFSSGINPASGVGVIISPKFKPFVTSISPHTDRIIEVHISLQGPPLRIFGVYTPHQGKPPKQKIGPLHDPHHPDHKKDTRQQFWKKLKALMTPNSQAYPTLVVGDLNTRLPGQATHRARRLRTSYIRKRP